MRRRLSGFYQPFPWSVIAPIEADRWALDAGDRPRRARSRRPLRTDNVVHLAVDESCVRRLLGDATHLPRRLYVHPCLCGRIRAQDTLFLRILGFVTPRGQTPVRMNRHDRRATRWDGERAAGRGSGWWPSTRRSRPRPTPQAVTCGSTGAAGGASMPPGSSLSAGPCRSSGTGCWPKGLRGASAAACRAPRGPRWQSGFPLSLST